MDDVGGCCVVMRGDARCCVVQRCRGGAGSAPWCCVMLRGAAWCCVVLRGLPKIFSHFHSCCYLLQLVTTGSSRIGLLLLPCVALYCVLLRAAACCCVLLRLHLTHTSPPLSPPIFTLDATRSTHHTTHQQIKLTTTHTTSWISY